MKKIKVIALSLIIMIAGMVAISASHSTGVDWGKASISLAFVPLAFVKQLKEKGVYDKLDTDTKAYVDTLEVELNKAFTENAKGLLSEKDFNDKIESLKKDFKGLPDGITGAELLKMKEDLQKEIDGFVEFQKEYNKKGSSGPKQAKTLEQAVMEACAEKKDEIETILKNGGNQSGPLTLKLKGFSTKSAITITDLATIEAAGSASHWSLTSNTGIISQIRKRILTYLQNVMVGGLSVDKPYAMWIEELDEQGTPIFIAEGASKTQLSVRYEEREKKAKKIAVYGKVSTEFLRYLNKLVSYVQNNLMKRMDIVTEDQLFTGDDTGEHLKGIVSYATQFDGGKGVANGQGLVGLVHNPSYADVFRAISLQVTNSYGTPVAVWTSFDILAAMDTDKSKTAGLYLLPPFRSADGQQVAGMKIIGTNALAGTGIDFIGGDTSVINVEFLENATIQIGLDGNDFTNNLKTILMEQQLVQFVSANDTKVLIKGTMNAAKALINSGS